MHTPPLFLVDELRVGASEAVLTGEEARHAAKVLRLRPGEPVSLGNGAGVLARGTVLEVQPGRDVAVRIALDDRGEVPRPQPRVTVVQALAKGDRGDLAVELATEAGADAIVPWRAARCVARWDDGPRGAKALARWRSTARAATKQARRPWLPDVTEPVDTAGLLARVNDAAVTVILDGEAAQPVSDLTWPSDGEVLVVVGPEGGISGEERDRLRAAGAASARLGPHVLRTSTAGAIALAALGVLTRRWE